MASTVGAYEAKTHLPQLLERVSKGERITITKHGVPVAVLVPPAENAQPDVRKAIEEMKRFQDEQGPTLGPDLTTGKWLWGDGSLAAIAHTIATGVPQPKDYGSPMSPKGGAELSSAQVTALAAYVWTLSRQNGR